MKEEKMARCGCTTNGGENGLVSARDMLKFGKKVLEEDQYQALHHAYRQQFWLQIGFCAALVVLLAASALLTAVWDRALTVGLIAAIVITFLWVLFSPFFTGRLWGKYVRWYRRGRKLETLPELFRE